MTRVKRNKFNVLSNEKGQASVEAAFLIPVVLFLLVLLLQPAFLLYDYLVMSSAASEACRLLVTKTDSLGSSTAACEAFVRHRLGSIPPLSCFHLHEESCTWQIELQGDEHSDRVSVSITTEVKPLPLVGSFAHALGMVTDDGNFRVSASCSQSSQPDWVWESESGVNPADWVGKWEN